MYILISSGNINIPEIPEGEILHILTTPESTIPVSLLNSKEGFQIHMLPSDASEQLTIFMLGCLVGSGTDTDYILFTDNNTKIDLDDVMVNGKTIRYGIKKEGTKRGKVPTSQAGTRRRTVKKNAETNPEKKEKNPFLKESQKVALLQKAGVRKDLILTVLESVNGSSDAALGLDIMLKTKLAAVNASDEKDDILRKITPLYEQLKR